MTASAAAEPVLVVDLDGTLLRTDLLVESILYLIKRDPLHAFALPAWLLRGRAMFKRMVAAHTPLDAALLPYREDLVAYLRAERARGRRIVLATGADSKQARQVAEHIGVFEDVLASDGRTNLTGENKRAALVERYGEGGFDYAGDSFRDLPVWASTRSAILVDPEPGLRRRLERTGRLGQVFEDRPPGLAVRVKALRLHQWVKNVLVFLPLVAAQRLDETALLVPALLGFLAIGLCASGTYLLNDLLDLPSDRRHPRKRHRPFASGTLSLRWGLTMFPVLMGLGLALGAVLPAPFLAVLVIYLGTTLLYSLYLKSIAMLDVITLSTLYTARVLAGSATTDIWPSHWLLGLCVFMFLSLAMVKRYSEVTTIGENAFRGYRIEDAPLLATLGAASGYIAVLVFALYIATDHVQESFERYRLLWLICPMMLYWVSDLWLSAHRRGIDDDPLVYALKDPTSRIVLALIAVTYLVAV